MNFFCNTTGRLPIINQSLAVYEFTCPDCANYGGKTKITLHERRVEHYGVIKTALSKITLTLLKYSTNLIL